MRNLTGRIAEVTTSTLGTTATRDHVAGETVISVASVALFRLGTAALGTVALSAEEAGGALLIYRAVDEVAGTITLDASSPAMPDLPVDATVHPFPLSVEKVAQVILDGADRAVPCEVASSIEHRLPEGPRDPGEEENVLLELDAGRLMVVNLAGEPKGARLEPQGLAVEDPVTGEQAATIDELGNARVRDFTYEGNLYGSAETFMVNGSPLSVSLDRTKYLSPPAKRTGVLVTNISNTAYAIMHVRLYIPSARAARIALEGTVEPTTNAATRYFVRVRYAYSATAWPAEPTTATTAVILDRMDVTGTVSGADADFSHASEAPSLAAGYYIFRVEVEGFSGATVTVNAVKDWTFTIYDNGPPVTVNPYYAPPAPGTLGAGGTDNSGAGTGGGAVPTGQTFTTSFVATTSRWWEGGDLANYRASDNQYVGYLSGEGNRRSALWFDNAAITAALTGANVTKVEFIPAVWEGGNGKTVRVAAHTDATVRSNFNSITGITGYVSKTGVNEGTSPVIDLSSLGLGSWLNTFKGLIVGPGLNNDAVYKFSYRGANYATASKRPTLKITYTK